MGGFNYKMMGATGRLGALSLIALALALGGCAEVRLAVHGVKRVQDAVDSKSDTTTRTARPEPALGPQPRYKVGKPYQIDGVWYYPRVDADYDETGIASWYGTDFHGKTTANGEIYDMNALTAAHKTLPLPSIVRVANLENGRSVTLRVNDRGPFVHRRIIDVSRRASQLLGFHKQGIAKVRVSVLQSGGKRFIADKPKTSEEERRLALAAPRDRVTSQALPPPSGVFESPAPSTGPATPEVRQYNPQATTMYVQAAAFANPSNADRLLSKLAVIGPTTISKATIKGQVFHRVRLGPLATVADADTVLARVMESGFPGARIVVDCNC